MNAVTEAVGLLGAMLFVMLGALIVLLSQAVARLNRAVALLERTARAVESRGTPDTPTPQGEPAPVVLPPSPAQLRRAYRHSAAAG